MVKINLMILIIILISLVIYTEAVIYFISTIDVDRVVGNMIDSDSMGQFIFEIVNYIAILLILEVYFLLFLFGIAFHIFSIVVSGSLNFLFNSSSIMSALFSSWPNLLQYMPM